MLNNLLARDEHSEMISPLRLALPLLLLGFPLLEIAVLIEVGQRIGFWPTLGLLFLSALAGVVVIRDQGVSMIGRMFDTLGRGGLALGSMIDSYVVIFAGGLLIMPGFVSDVLAIALLIPPLRRLMLRALLPGFADTGRRKPSAAAEQSQAGQDRGPIIIEGTYRRLDDEDPRG